MKRKAHPSLSSAGLEALASYEHWLREREDLAPASIRNYLSDLRHFIAWYETEREAQVHDSFTPQGITRPALTWYRTYLQTAQWQKPASVLFPSGKTKQAISERARGSIVKKYAQAAKLLDVSPHDLRHRFGYRMAESVLLHRLAQIMGHDSLDTTKLSIEGTKHDVQQAVETIAWR